MSCRQYLTRMPKKFQKLGIAVSFETLTTDLDLEDTYFVYRIRKIVLIVNGKCTIDVS